MKNIFLTSAFVLSALFSLAQTDTLRTKGRKTIPTVIGKWQLDSIVSTPKKALTPQTIEFLENGSYTLTNNSPAEETGKWKIENGALMRGEKSNAIENLTMKKMVLSELENKRKVYYYYSKMNYKAPAQDVIPH